MQAYGPGFARIYNLRWGDFSDQVAPCLLEFFERRGLASGHVLDLCCGAGHLVRHFLTAGWSVTGIDLSEHMLAHARRNCANWQRKGKAAFLLGDAAGYRLDQPVDAVVSTYDALNHLPDADALRGCFRATHKALKPGGWFLFDLNTALGLRSWNSLSVRDLDDAHIVTRGAYDESERRAWTSISGFFTDESGHWQRFSETIFNRVWSLDNVALWLRQAGFAHSHFARVRELDQPLTEPESERRVFVVAQA
ncbi:MAG: methyltransferase domain-containing protein [Candidatus Cloacimonetes bacterium]|nr:methyltransferase domain-containing protein [Candidatus Cloacimonadota bacterium]